MGIVVSHQFDGMAHRDIVQFHEVHDFWISFDLSCSFRSLSPGVVSWSSSLSFFSRVPLVLGRVTSLLVADEAFSVSDMLCPFIRREIDLVYVHGVRVRSRGSSSQWDIAVSSSLEFPELYCYDRGLPYFISPFSTVDCTMLNHFSFNDFIAIAFPDLARDLDVQI